MSPDDNISDTTAREILKHNEYGASLSCPAFKTHKGKPAKKKATQGIPVS